jgi:hypothetical protein
MAMLLTTAGDVDAQLGAAQRPGLVEPLAVVVVARHREVDRPAHHLVEELLEVGAADDGNFPTRNSGGWAWPKATEHIVEKITAICAMGLNNFSLPSNGKDLKAKVRLRIDIRNGKPATQFFLILTRLRRNQRT